jgi:hypothetical protein
LRTISTVLWAPACLHAEESGTLDFCWVVMRAVGLAGEEDQVEKPALVQCGDIISRELASG